MALQQFVEQARKNTPINANVMSLAEEDAKQHQLADTSTSPQINTYAQAEHKGEKTVQPSEPIAKSNQHGEDLQNGLTVNPLSQEDEQVLCAISAMQIRYSRSAEAIPYLMMVRKLNPENQDSVRLLALALMKLKRWNEAQIMVEELEQLQLSNGTKIKNGFDGMLHLYKSIVAFKTQRVSEARGYFNKFRSFIKSTMQGSTL